MASVISDLWGFMKQNKKWWLIPILFLLAVVSILIVFVGSSSISPFVYALF